MYKGFSRLTLNICFETIKWMEMIKLQSFQGSMIQLFNLKGKNTPLQKDPKRWRTKIIFYPTEIPEWAAYLAPGHWRSGELQWAAWCWNLEEHSGWQNDQSTFQPQDGQKRRPYCLERRQQGRLQRHRGCTVHWLFWKARTDVLRRLLADCCHSAFSPSPPSDAPYSFSSPWLQMNTQIGEMGWYL